MEEAEAAVVREVRQMDLLLAVQQARRRAEAVGTGEFGLEAESKWRDLPYQHGPSEVEGRACYWR